MSAIPSQASRPSVPRGVELLHDPLLNKGTAFTTAERDQLGLTGLLPSHVCSQEEQVARVLETIRRLPTDLDKHIALNALHDRNETLFFRVVGDNADEMVPIIYTPTVGLACQQWGHIFQQTRGLSIGANDRGSVAKVLRNWPRRDVSLIVVTDGERILGLGDLGASGMGIPVGKLSLYTACAGVPPERCLPVMLDVGSNNMQLLADPLYLGLRRKRLAGEAYDTFVDEFVTAAQEVFPGVLIQFEDFGNHNAFRLLARYRERIPTFNDDIQGTAAVALAGILSALRLTQERLVHQKILFFGAGEAATGIADLIVLAMMREGLPQAEARRRCWLFDSHGLVVASRTDLASHKLAYAHEEHGTGSFLEAVETLRPTAIIGVAAKGGTFTEHVLRAMARINARPIVFALSNPTSKSECTAEQAYAATHGRALFACGSPFDPVDLYGQRFVPRQGNNAYVFPGVGLGVIASGARRVTDAMFLAAADALAAEVTAADLEHGSLYPPLASIREVSARIAAAVADVAWRTGLATRPVPGDVLAHVRSTMYSPKYPVYAV